MCTQRYRDVRAQTHRQRDTLSNLNPPHTDTVYNLHVVFVSSTLLLPVCFFNLAVYISESKPVSRTPSTAISMREKQIKMSDECKAWILTTFWLSLLLASRQSLPKLWIPQCQTGLSLDGFTIAVCASKRIIILYLPGSCQYPQTFVWVLFFFPKLALHCRRWKLQWRALWCLTLKSLHIPLRKSSTFWEIPLTICFLVRSYTGRLIWLSCKLNMKQLSEDKLKQRQTASMAA